METYRFNIRYDVTYLAIAHCVLQLIFFIKTLYLEKIYPNINFDITKIDISKKYNIILL